MTAAALLSLEKQHCPYSDFAHYPNSVYYKQCCHKHCGSSVCLRAHLSAFEVWIPESGILKCMNILFTVHTQILLIYSPYLNFPDHPNYVHCDNPPHPHLDQARIACFLKKKQLLSLSLFSGLFHDIYIFEECRPAVCRNFLNLSLSDLSSWLDFGHAFLVGIHDNAVSFSVGLVRKEGTMSVCPIFDDVNFDHLLEVVSVKSFH